MYKITHGLYDNQAVADFLELRPSWVRGHKYKLGCWLDVRKLSFKLRVTDQWNNTRTSGHSHARVGLVID